MGKNVRYKTVASQAEINFHDEMIIITAHDQLSHKNYHYYQGGDKLLKFCKTDIFTTSRQPYSMTDFNRINTDLTFTI